MIVTYCPLCHAELASEEENHNCPFNPETLMKTTMQIEAEESQRKHAEKEHAETFDQLNCLHEALKALESASKTNYHRNRQGASVEPRAEKMLAEQIEDATSCVMAALGAANVIHKIRRDALGKLPKSPSKDYCICAMPLEPGEAHAHQSCSEREIKSAYATTVDDDRR